MHLAAPCGIFGAPLLVSVVFIVVLGRYGREVLGGQEGFLAQVGLDARGLSAGVRSGSTLADRLHAMPAVALLATLPHASTAAHTAAASAPIVFKRLLMHALCVSDRWCLTVVESMVWSVIPLQLVKSLSGFCHL
jgi:hypothetical protein